MFVLVFCLDSVNFDTLNTYLCFRLELLRLELTSSSGWPRTQRNLPISSLIAGIKDVCQHGSLESKYILKIFRGVMSCKIR